MFEVNTMKKITMVLLAVLVLGIVGAGAAYAYMGGFERQGKGAGNTDVQSIMSTGTYQDLVAYRASTGFNVMPWVQDEADFALAQQMHTRMLQWREDNNQTFGRGSGQRHFGCPMMSNDGDE